MTRPRISKVILEDGTTIEVPETFSGIIRVAVAKYMDDVEHTDIGDKLRHDIPTLTALRDTKTETARSSFYIDTAGMTCVHCGNTVNNECPDLVCLKCSRSVEYMNKTTADFCLETCTQTSMENCKVFKTLIESRKP